ncbi:MAG: ABC-F family ATP-binding cassette domain-containing protein [Oscillospiraceae bacterium]|nr:ABC-F family ATP-binding cassette domain-containing protein [Oscillospiraceae bacterium]MBR0450918.1 ABC-F family ATP-binding cassette domain-containing protein [Oscillospiraceae bacterium]
MVLSVENIAFSYGANQVLQDVSFQIEENDRVGLVGYNGCGKTTLFGVLTGELYADSGYVSLKEGAILGYLKQNNGLVASHSVKEEIERANNANELLERMKALEQSMGDDPSLLDEYRRVCDRYEAIDGYHLSYQIRKLLIGMGFPEDTWDKHVAVLSGGEKTRLSLAKLLLQSPDILLLDEPTNHLDLNTLDWLEGYLKSYRGAVLIVSHDQHFLDAVCTKTIQLQNGKTKTYPCGFSEYLRRKEQEEIIERKHYEQTVEKAEKYQEFAEKNMARASTRNMAKSRLKMLERLDLTAPEDSKHTDLKFEIIPANEPYKDVLTLEDLSIGVSGRVLCSGLDLLLERGDRLAVIGNNGTGKTTLLKTILGEQRPMHGRVIIGGGVKTGIQEQNVFQIENNSPLMYIWDRYPQMDQLQVRKLLALVGFRNEEVFTESKGLSGGELARLNMARLSLEHPNFLILDEPTNHLDIFTKQILFDALNEYTGTLLLVSHDRWLIEQLGCRILLIEDGKGTLYEDYAAFRSAAQQTRNASEPVQDVPRKKTESLNAKEVRRQKAEYRQRKSFLEKMISELEAKEKELQEQIADPENASNAELLADLCNQLDDTRNELSGYIDEYLEQYSEE